MRIDSSSGLFRRPTAGLGVPSRSPSTGSGRPAQDPTLAPDAVNATRVNRAYSMKTTDTRPAADVKVGAGPALSMSLSPTARAWLADRGLASDPTPTPLQTDGGESLKPVSGTLVSPGLATVDSTHPAVPSGAEVPLPRYTVGGRLNVAL